MTKPTRDELVELIALALVASETNLKPTDAYLESRRRLADVAIQTISEFHNLFI